MVRGRYKTCGEVDLYILEVALFASPCRLKLITASMIALRGLDRSVASSCPTSLMPMRKTATFGRMGPTI